MSSFEIIPICPPQNGVENCTVHFILSRINSALNHDSCLVSYKYSIGMSGVYSFQYGLVCGEFMICSQALSAPSVIPHGPELPERAVSCVESICGKGSRVPMGHRLSHVALQEWGILPSGSFAVPTNLL